MRISTFITRVFAAAALASVALVAAEGVAFGVQAGVGFPTSDLKDTVDKKAGYNAGVFALVDLGGGHALRPRLDFAQFKGDMALSGVVRSGTTVVPISGSVTNRVSSLSLGMDYLYFLEGSPERGLYGVAGLGVSRNKLAMDMAIKAAAGQANASSSLSSTRACANLGLGYQFNSAFGMELGYHLTQFGAQTADVKINATLNGVTGTFTERVQASKGNLGNVYLNASYRF